MTTLQKIFRLRFFAQIAICLAAISSTNQAADSHNPFVGRWALTLPDNEAGWLQITAEDGYYDGKILWGTGSVLPVDNVGITDDSLYVTRIRPVERKNHQGKVIRTQRITDLIVAKVDGDNMELTLIRPRSNGEGVDQEQFTGKRIPPVPPAPDLSKVKFGAPVQLFNGKNLDGWRLTNPNQANGWIVEDGILKNNPVQHEGKPRISYGNLRTDQEFADFNLTLETNVPKDGNSGVYLRGTYEVQVADTYGHKVDSHNMGAIYSRITPSVAAEKPPGEWQTLDITLVDRHVTVILNGQKIIGNQPLLGCTGGALWSDELRPGPIYLQGDHLAVQYRNIVLKPVVKD